MTPHDPLGELLRRGLLAGSEQAATENLEDALDALPPADPVGTLRSRLLDTLSSQPMAPLGVPLAGLFAIAVTDARDLLANADHREDWEQMAPGIALLHVDGGPETADADVGLVAVDEGVDFPFHVHTGEERNLILRGTLIDDDGTRYGPGDVFVHPAGSHHTFRADGRLLFAVVAWGVDFDVSPVGTA